MPHIAFVCRFNMARSVMAAAVFVEELRRCGLGDAVRVSSAGTGALAGARVDTRAARVLAQRGYPPRWTTEPRSSTTTT